MLDVSSNIKQFSRGFSKDFKRQIPFATSMALNNTAFKVREHIQEKLPQVFDRPTPFTKKGVVVSKSKKRHLVASVFFKENRADYLQFPVFGKTKRPKRAALTVYAKNAKQKDKFGNIRASRLQRINADDKRFFAGVPKGHPDLPGGIYERYAGNKRIRMVAHYTERADYSKQFDFFRFAERSAKQHFDREFRKAFAKAVATRRR